ncbi:MAG: transposase [Ideonella sp.]|nr:transposase [Ideonella sp.]MDZ7814415.1 transposase [Ideonella sp.]
MSTKPSDQAFDKRRTRRTYSAAFKAKAVTASLRPGNSLAGVAHANGIHITLLRRWVRESQMRAGIDLQRPTPSKRSAAAFLPLELPAQRTGADIRIELRRGATLIAVTWPAAAAAECAAWMREVLR